MVWTADSNEVTADSNFTADGGFALPDVSMLPSGAGPSLAAPFNLNQFRAPFLNNSSPPLTALSAQAVTFALTLEGVTLGVNTGPLTAQVVPFTLTVEGVVFSGNPPPPVVSSSGGAGLGMDLGAGFFLN